jgi:hypothetical protein
MNLKQFKQVVDHAYESACRYANEEHHKVVIVVKTVGSAGGTPCVEVQTASEGFDWDNGKLMLFPTSDLREISRDEIASLRKNYEELSWKHYEISNMKRENKALRAQIAELKKEK